MHSYLTICKLQGSFSKLTIELRYRLWKAIVTEGRFVRRAR